MIVHPSNPVSDLSREQIQAIFGGATRSWAYTALAPGDLHVGWTEGALVRDTGAICRAMQDALAGLSFGPTRALIGFMNRIGSFGIGRFDSAAWSA